MFNLGAGELAIIFIVLIIAVGPDRLPTMMKGLGKAIRTVRAASREIRTTVGIDEMMREDVLAPPRRPPPKAVVSRPVQPAAQLPAPAPAVQADVPTPDKAQLDAQSANAAPVSTTPAPLPVAPPAAGTEPPREPSPQKEPE
jgi:Sec-independent protein translocase protein TatA